MLLHPVQQPQAAPLLCQSADPRQVTVVERFGDVLLNAREPFVHAW
jgi:hypothetical protein